jgi:hypothetical protein
MNRGGRDEERGDKEGGFYCTHQYRSDYPNPSHLERRFQDAAVENGPTISSIPKLNKQNKTKKKKIVIGF